MVTTTTATRDQAMTLARTMVEQQLGAGAEITGRLGQRSSGTSASTAREENTAVEGILELEKGRNEPLRRGYA